MRADYLGTSYSTQRPVGAMILERVPVTLDMGLLSCLITIVLGIIVGVISAVKQYSVLDYITSTLAVFFASMPNLWLALMGIIILSQTLHLLPTGRRVHLTIYLKEIKFELQ